MATLKENKARRATILVALTIAAGMLLSTTAQIAHAQTSASTTAEVQTVYESSYSKTSSDGSVSVRSEFHIYKPGDTVKIQGHVSSETRQETDADSVMVNIMDTQGTIVANQQASVSSNGEYAASITLPASAEEGRYDISSKIEVSASVLGLLDAEIVANLEASTQFVIATSSTFEVQNEEGKEFQIEIASNSNIDNVEFRQDEKRVSFVVEGETGTTGVTEVTIPKAMLSGEMMVLIDGEVVTAESNDVIVKSGTEAEVTFEINYHHSEHTIEVTGTNVTPEFPLSAMIMTAAVASIIGLFAVGKKAGRLGGLGG